MWHNVTTTVKLLLPFCLRPSAKDKGITWVVVLVVLVHHLVHFLIKRNLSGKKFSRAGIQTWDLQITSLALYQLRYRDIIIKLLENYLPKYFKNHAADLGPILVDTCVCLRSRTNLYFCYFWMDHITSLTNIHSYREKLGYLAIWLKVCWYRTFGFHARIVIVILEQPSWNTILNKIQNPE